MTTNELLEFEPEHLAWPADPTILDVLDHKAARAYLLKRKTRIEQSKVDPLGYCYEPSIWEKVDWHIKDLRTKFPKGVIKIIIFGGHRSGKTYKAANYVNHALVRKPGSRWWCCDSTEAQSRANQMRLMWEQFPKEWKNLERDQVTDIRYSQADGFSKNLFVAPNKSEVAFKFYSMDLESLPGPELDGVWADELIPLDWIHFLGFRCANRNGIILVTFCPEFGWNETFGYFYEGAQVIEEVEAPLLPKLDGDGNRIGHKKVPRVMQCSDPTARIIFFHTEDNPFGNYPALVQELKGKQAREEEISVRAYGLCTKSHNVAFPFFSERTHVITRQAFNELVKEYPQGQRYHFVDPCSGRNWAQIWVFCPYADKFIIYREWPSHGYREAYVEGVGMPGPWALSGEAADGVAGPAQKTWGFGLQRYIEEILSKEKGEAIFARYIDSRYSSASITGRERTTTLIEQLSEEGMDFLGMTPESRILGVKDGSIDLINSALYYDVETEIGKFSSKAGRLNVPNLQIVENCPNTVWALGHWSGADGQKGACKDFVDCIRGLFLSDVNYLADDVYSWKNGGIPR